MSSPIWFTGRYPTCMVQNKLPSLQLNLIRVDVVTPGSIEYYMTDTGAQLMHAVEVITVIEYKI